MTDRPAFDRVCDNLRFFLTRLRGLPCCRSLELEGGGFCVSTRSEAASDNWAFLPGPLTGPGPVEAALRFFEGCGPLPFVWPLLGDGEGFLRGAGLREAGRLLAMRRSPGRREGTGKLGLSLQPARSRDEARRWADAAWLGFGGEGSAPESFRALADAMRGEDPLLRLATARLGDEDVGTFLLAESGAGLGVYYFAVRPEYRRRGVAAAMMDEIGRAALDGGAEILLQATPAGVPFYRSAGFEPLGEIPLFSASDDVF